MPATGERRLREGDVTVMEDRRRSRRTFLMAHSFEVSIAIAVILTSIQFLLDPSVRKEVAIGSTGILASWMWTVLYLLGGTGMLWGMFRLDDRIELAGLCCFVSACLVNAFGLWEVRGERAIYIAMIFAALAVGSGVRIHLLLKLRRIFTDGKP